MTETYIRTPVQCDDLCHFTVSIPRIPDNTGVSGSMFPVVKKEVDLVMELSDKQWVQSLIAQWFEPGEDPVEELPSICVLLFSVISSHDMTRAEAALVPVREA